MDGFDTYGTMELRKQPYDVLRTQGHDGGYVSVGHVVDGVGVLRIAGIGRRRQLLTRSQSREDAAPRRTSDVDLQPVQGEQLRGGRGRVR